jgi:DNA polymerase III epsilon subunit-like protein
MKYCSLDIEATGFDPEFNQIIELGFVIFDITGNKLEVIEKWEQVFNPGIPVEAKILGLTGITEQELLDAPEFASSFDFLIYL